MHERENDQLRKYGNGPADDFPSEWDVPSLSDARPPKKRKLWRGDADVIVLSSDEYAEQEFPSERDLTGRTAGSVLAIVPAQSVRASSLTDVETGPGRNTRAWLKATSISGASFGLAVVALGAAIYLTLPAPLTVARDGSTAPIAANSDVSHDATVPTMLPGLASEPSHPDSRDASAVAGPKAAPPAGAPGSAIASEKLRERPRETFVNQLRSDPETPLVTGTLTALAALSETSNVTPISPDLESPGTASELSGGEPAAVPTATERLDEAPPELPIARGAGTVVAPVATPPGTVVQGVLARYAQAYGRLDASAVKDIWPTVDERALARAFSALQAQSIVFDACDLTIDGTRATAACHGTATYVTGVGKPNHVTQPRQWTFLLEQSPERWEIQRIQVR